MKTLYTEHISNNLPTPRHFKSLKPFRPVTETSKTLVIYWISLQFHQLRYFSSTHMIKTYSSINTYLCNAIFVHSCSLRTHRYIRETRNAIDHERAPSIDRLVCGDWLHLDNKYNWLCLFPTQLLLVHSRFDSVVYERSPIEYLQKSTSIKYKNYPFCPHCSLPMPYFLLTSFRITLEHGNQCCFRRSSERRDWTGQKEIFVPNIRQSTLLDVYLL